MGARSRARGVLDVAHLLVPMRMLHRRVFRPDEARELERKKVFYRQFVQRGSLVFDIGANRGERTEVFLALGALVVAAEPVAHLAGELRYWIGNHRRFVLEQRALGATEGTATMYVADLDVLSTLDPAWVDACRRQPHLSHARWNEETVQVTTLDRLIERYGTPSFAKIDVEGFEVEVLRGCPAGFRRSPSSTRPTSRNQLSSAWSSCGTSVQRGSTRHRVRA